MSFKIGDKVVCVDDSPPNWSFLTCETPNGMPTKGPVHAVIGFRANGTNIGIGRLHFDTLLIQGFPNSFEGVDVGWKAIRFRLVSEVGHPPISIQQPQPCTS